MQWWRKKEERPETVSGRLLIGEELVPNVGWAIYLERVDVFELVVSSTSASVTPKERGTKGRLARIEEDFSSHTETARRERQRPELTLGGEVIYGVDAPKRPRIHASRFSHSSQIARVRSRLAPR